MDNYRMTVGIEPTNDYDKAKQDVMQAILLNSHQAFGRFILLGKVIPGQRPYLLLNI